MKSTFLFVAIMVLASCSRSPNELCKCIEETEKLNQLSQELLDMSDVSKEKFDTLVRLRFEMDSLCAPFKNMGTEELYDLRNECIDKDLLELKQ
jgi:hypothetical protein